MVEQCYPIYNREYLVIVRGLRHWAYLLKGTAQLVIILTDHKNLLFYQELHNLSNRVAGWVSKLAQYNIKIIYKPRSTNRVDTLSRCPDYAVDPSNDDPIIALPTDLFVTPTTGEYVVHIQILAKLTSLESTDTQMDVEAMVRLTDINNHLAATDVDTTIIVAQSEYAEVLEKWHRAHSLETLAGMW